MSFWRTKWVHCNFLIVWECIVLIKSLRRHYKLYDNLRVVCVLLLNLSLFPIANFYISMTTLASSATLTAISPLLVYHHHKKTFLFLLLAFEWFNYSFSCFWGDRTTPLTTRGGSLTPKNQVVGGRTIPNGPWGWLNHPPMVFGGCSLTHKLFPLR